MIDTHMWMDVSTMNVSEMISWSTVDIYMGCLQPIFLPSTTLKYMMSFLTFDPRYLTLILIRNATPESDFQLFYRYLDGYLFFWSNHALLLFTDAVFGSHLHRICDKDACNIPHFVSKSINAIERRGIVPVFQLETSLSLSKYFHWVNLMHLTWSCHWLRNLGTLDVDFQICHSVGIEFIINFRIVELVF